VWKAERAQAEWIAACKDSLLQHAASPASAAVAGLMCPDAARRARLKKLCDAGDADGVCDVMASGGLQTDLRARAWACVLRAESPAVDVAAAANGQHDERNTVPTPPASRRRLPRPTAGGTRFESDGRGHAGRARRRARAVALRRDEGLVDEAPAEACVPSPRPRWATPPA
jgi:hypothetical protein